MQTLSEFIAAHIGDDPVKLALNRSKYPDVDMKIVVETLLSREKLKNKLPRWYAEPSLILPYSLSAEQCSGEETAGYKAALASRLCKGQGGHIRIADLTGGLGSDCAAFSQVAESVLYNEMSPLLCRCVQHNFAVLGIDNCLFSNQMVEPGAVGGIIGDFSPALIYLDPARRSDRGGKVFHIEDCSPDVSLLKDELLDAAPIVMIKLSPMADISLVLQKMGERCSEIHIVGTTKECKELLLVMERGHRGDCIVAVDGFSFTLEEEREAVPIMADSAPVKGDMLLEPVKKVMKAAPFNLLSSRFGVKKLDRSTHVYLGRMSEPSSLFHCCEVLECVELNSRNIKETGKRYPKADVVSHNTPISSDDLRKRLKCSSGNEIRIFALHLGATSSNILAVCRKLW